MAVRTGSNSWLCSFAGLGLANVFSASIDHDLVECCYPLMSSVVIASPIMVILSGNSVSIWFKSENVDILSNLDILETIWAKSLNVGEICGKITFLAMASPISVILS